MTILRRKSRLTERVIESGLKTGFVAVSSILRITYHRHQGLSPVEYPATETNRWDLAAPHQVSERAIRDAEECCRFPHRVAWPSGPPADRAACGRVGRLGSRRGSRDSGTFARRFRGMLLFHQWTLLRASVLRLEHLLTDLQKPVRWRL